MVKGVSKMVIEVNNTGSELFEKVVFYVTPKYGNLSAKQLKEAASSFTFNYGINNENKRYKKRYRLRWKRIFLFSAPLLIGGVIALIKIL